jgi:hypothetical protein
MPVPEIEDYFNPREMECLIHKQRKITPIFFRHTFKSTYPPEGKACSILDKMLNPDQEQLPPGEAAHKKRDHINQNVDKAWKGMLFFIAGHPFVLQQEITNKVGDKGIHLMTISAHILSLPLLNIQGYDKDRRLIFLDGFYL